MPNFLIGDIIQCENKHFIYEIFDIKNRFIYLNTISKLDGSIIIQTQTYESLNKYFEKFIKRPTLDKLNYLINEKTKKKKIKK